MRADPVSSVGPLAPGGLPARLAELSGIAWRPTEAEPVPVVHRAPAGPLDPARPFRVVSWNVQFAGTRRRKFFYDGGDAVHVPPEDRDFGVAAVAAELRRLDGDIVLLQELDRDSDRTGRLDEVAALLDRVPYPTWTSATCHRCRYVPVPAQRPLGRVEMHVGVFSRFTMTAAVRHQLPLLREPRWRQAFNLKRCLLAATVPVSGWDRPLHVAVTHLSAFSRGDGTLGRQVAVLRAWMEARERAGEPYVLGGDLNLLPPGDDPKRLGAEAAEYADRPNPIEALIPRFRSVVPPERLRDATNATYLPWGAPVADRVLDYVFVSPGIDVLEAGPAVTADPVSDHHPVVATLKLSAPAR